MTTGRQLGLVGIGLFAGYLIWRLNEAKQTGGPVIFVNPFTYLPASPSPARPEERVIGNETNPISGFFAAVTNALKLPGNKGAVHHVPPSIGSAVDPVGPPNTPTLTMQPEPSPFLGLSAEDGFVPNLGDPNFSSWNYLASTPPDLAWGLKGGTI